MDWLCEFKLKLADSKRSLLNINLAIDFIYVVRFFYSFGYSTVFSQLRTHLARFVPICSVCAECMHNLDSERHTIRRLVQLRYEQSATLPPSVHVELFPFVFRVKTAGASLSLSIVPNFDDCILVSRRCYSSTSHAATSTEEKQN